MKKVHAVLGLGCILFVLFFSVRGLQQSKELLNLTLQDPQLEIEFTSKVSAKEWWITIYPIIQQDIGTVRGLWVQDEGKNGRGAIQWKGKIQGQDWLKKRNQVVHRLCERQWIQKDC